MIRRVSRGAEPTLARSLRHSAAAVGRTRTRSGRPGARAGGTLLDDARGGTALGSRLGNLGARGGGATAAGGLGIVSQVNFKARVMRLRRRPPAAAGGGSVTRSGARAHTRTRRRHTSRSCNVSRRRGSTPTLTPSAPAAATTDAAFTLRGVGAAPGEPAPQARAQSSKQGRTSLRRALLRSRNLRGVRGIRVVHRLRLRLRPPAPSAPSGDGAPSPAADGRRGW